MTGTGAGKREARGGNLPGLGGLGPWPRSIDLFLLILAAILSLEWFLIRAMDELQLADEGYLWYGAEALLRGEVPLRDFDAYDPGRYCWSVLWFKLWRPGLVPLRLAEALFKAGGLFLALLAAKRVTCDRWELAGLAFIFSLWMVPDHRVYEAVFPMAAAWFALRILEDPGRKMLFWGGVFLGLAAFFGRNNGLYLSLSFAALLLFFLPRKKSPGRTLGSLAAGCAVGSLPFLSMFLLTPGFFSAWMGNNQRILDRGTNIPLPFPWPWEIPPYLAGQGALWHALFGCFFMAALAFHAYWIPRMALLPKKPFPPPLAASVLVGAPYLHYALSRADLEHLAVAMAPFFLGLFSLPVPALWRRVGLAGVAGLSLVLMGPGSGLMEAFEKDPGGKIQVRVGEDLIPMHPVSARLIEGMRLVSTDLREGEALLAFPHLPGLYPALGLRSPVRAIYQAFDASEAEQRLCVEQMEEGRVKWVVVDDWRINGKRHEGFRQEHPLVTEYFARNFHQVPAPFIPDGWLLLRRNKWAGEPVPWPVARP